MNTLRILFVVFFGIVFKRDQNFAKFPNNEILFSPRVTNANILFTSLANYHKHCKYPKESICTELLQLLLVISGNVELNPGPRTPKYTCGECRKEVSINSIACDTCNTWYDRECAGMNLTIFESYVKNLDMEWECTQCGMPNISNSIFDSSISSSYSSSTTEEIITNSKAK